MQVYEIVEENNLRVLTVLNKQQHRFRFYNIIDNKRVPVRFKNIGARDIAIVSDKVIVYTKPRLSDYHREYMRLNARGQWLHLLPDYDLLTENMLEFVEEI